MKKKLSKNTLEVSDESQLVMNPLVSVLMITYNHVDYLAQAIEGVVRQVCHFPFELLVGEDASKDGTLEIALEYQRRYPKIIRVFYSDTNVGMNANAWRIFVKARGRYIAYCDGDDFWCAPEKLAQQVALIESDEKIGIVHSDWTRSYQKDGQWFYNYEKSVHHRVSKKYLAGYIFDSWHYPKILRACTVLVRKNTMIEFYECGLMDDEYQFGDSVLAAWITARALVGYLPAVTAVYRVSPNSALRSGAKARVAFYRSALEFDTSARRFFDGKADYQNGYRWDSAAGLLLWGLRARDWSAVREALFDFKKHFTLCSFISTGCRTIVMRLPTVQRQPRRIPGQF